MSTWLKNVSMSKNVLHTAGPAHSLTTPSLPWYQVVKLSIMTHKILAVWKKVWQAPEWAVGSGLTYHLWKLDRQKKLALKCQKDRRNTREKLWITRAKEFDARGKLNTELQEAGNLCPILGMAFGAVCAGAGSGGLGPAISLFFGHIASRFACWLLSKMAAIGAQTWWERAATLFLGSRLESIKNKRQYLECISQFSYSISDCYTELNNFKCSEKVDWAMIFRIPAF